MQLVTQCVIGCIMQVAFEWRPRPAQPAAAQHACALVSHGWGCGASSAYLDVAAASTFAAAIALALPGAPAMYQSARAGATLGQQQAGRLLAGARAQARGVGPAYRAEELLIALDSL